VTEARDETLGADAGSGNALVGATSPSSSATARFPLTAEGLPVSFSLPNFYFHATTAYDILRIKARRSANAISSQAELKTIESGDRA